MTETKIRWLIQADRKAIEGIERASCCSPAWSWKDVQVMLKQRHSIGKVIEIADRVVAYMAYDLEHTEAVIARLLVHPEHRRRGLGRRLVSNLVARRGPRRNRVVVELRHDNGATMEFFRACGFRCAKVMRAATNQVPYFFEFECRLPGDPPCR